MWRLIARMRGWLEAVDNDGDQPLLVVWHPVLAVHFTGPQAWRAAAQYNLRR